MSEQERIVNLQVKIKEAKTDVYNGIILIAIGSVMISLGIVFSRWSGGPYLVVSALLGTFIIILGSYAIIHYSSRYKGFLKEIKKLQAL